jgi:hypothetical protein
LVCEEGIRKDARKRAEVCLRRMKFVVEQVLEGSGEFQEAL